MPQGFLARYLLGEMAEMTVSKFIPITNHCLPLLAAVLAALGAGVTMV